MERDFSAAGYFVSDRCARLRPALVDDMLLMHGNADLLASKADLRTLTTTGRKDEHGPLARSGTPEGGRGTSTTADASALSASDGRAVQAIDDT